MKFFSSKSTKPAEPDVPLDSAPIGLIAGKGKFPLLFAQEAKKNGKVLVVIALKDEMNENLAPYAKAIHEIPVGKLDSVIQALKKEGVQQVAMVGKVEHVKIFSDIVPDFRTAQLLLKIKDRRADSILGSVADEFKKDGITLLPSIMFLKHLVPGPGHLTKRKLNESEERNVLFGIEMAKSLAAMDCGQTVVVKRRTLLAVEAIEGTDECIRRGAQWGGEEVIVVKSAKPNQDLRFDVPVIGMNTIKTMLEVKSKVLAIEAHRSLFLEKDECVALAEKNGISISAWERK